MDGPETRQLKKDWIVMLASTSGIMLTISLMILTIVYTTQSNQIPDWQRAVISGCILFASIFLVLCADQSLRALGALIIAAGYQEKADNTNADKAKIDNANKAVKAQIFFRLGMIILVLAVLLTFIFLSWPTVGSLFGPPNYTP